MRGPDFDFRNINIPRSNVTQEGVICTLCNTLTKRFTYHVKKFHKDSLINGSKAFESQFKNFLNTVRQQRHMGQRDLKELRDSQRQRKRDSRKRLKEENQKKGRANKRKENVSQRKGLPCAICFKHSPGFPHAGDDFDFEKAMIKRMATLAVEAAHSLALNPQSDSSEYLAAMEEGTRMVVNNKEEATTQSDAEYGGAWEEESDMEEDVEWKLVRPQWIVELTAKWAKENGRIKRVIHWNLDHGTKDEHERLRWKLRKLDKYADWLWLDIQKVCKEHENLSKETCAEEEEENKEWALSVFKNLYTLEYEEILCRFCPTFCKRKKPKID